jgi:hypothetical protein
MIGCRGDEATLSLPFTFHFLRFTLCASRFLEIVGKGGEKKGGIDYFGANL